MTAPRVFFVVQSDRFDITAARKFGEPAYLTSKTASPFAPDEFTIEVIEGADRLKFDPLSDYVALTGPAASVAIGYGTLMVRYGRLRTLMFDARSSEYVLRMVGAGVAA